MIPKAKMPGTDMLQLDMQYFEQFKGVLICLFLKTILDYGLGRGHCRTGGDSPFWIHGPKYDATI